MGDPEKLFGGWPGYLKAPPDHLHALGVISLNYNTLENHVLNLFRYYLLVQTIPADFSEFLLTEFNTQQRAEAIKKALTCYETDTDVIDRVDHLLKFWSWCFQARNTLLHAHESDPVGSPADIMSLTKRSQDNFAKLNFMYMSLPHLRAIADAMHQCDDFAINIIWFLISRRTLTADLRAGMPGAALPDKPQIPRPIKVRDKPVDEET